MIWIILCAILSSTLSVSEAGREPSKDQEALSGSQPDIEDECSSPLGMEHGHIEDADIQASSAFDFKSVGPQNARINKDTFGGAWCPKKPVEKGVREWIEIDLHKDYRITRTGTQGRYGGGRGREYAEEFIFEYWRAGMSEWRVYRNHSGHEILPGNKNTYVVNLNELNPPIVASKVRFVPHSKHPRTVCMRVEVYGCLYESGLLSYSAPPGDEFSPHVYLADVYDGVESHEGRLEGGLGLLTDGNSGGNITYSQHGIETAPGWVGWKKLKHHVELIFEFSSLRKFESITFVTHANRDMGIQPFSHMVASFSDAGRSYGPDRLTKPNKRAALELSDVDSVKLSLDGRRGRFLKVQLFFTDKWILLSEISFESKSLPPGSNGLEYEESESNEVASVGRFDEKKDEKGASLSSPDSDNSVALSDTPSEEFKDTVIEDQEDSLSEAKGSPFSQVYIGLIIGVLGVTVLLLLVTIAIMMRRNKQKIFNKHSLFKSPAPNRLHHPSYAPGIITLRDLKSQQHVSPAQMYGSHIPEESHEDGGSSSYYHEPYRLILKPGARDPAINSNSCGRLCEYEEFGLLQDKPKNTSSPPHHHHLLEKNGQFGSTPLFPPPPSHKLLLSGGGGANNNHYKSNGGYATTDFVKKWGPPPNNNESFYAATDILTGSGGDRNEVEAGMEDKNRDALSGGFSYTPMTLRPKTEDPEHPIPEYSRRNLRMIEKLGQGNFGMIHLCETASLGIKDSRLSRSISSCSSSRQRSHIRLTGDSSFLPEESPQEEEASPESSGSDSEQYGNVNKRLVVVVRSLWKPTSEYRRKAFMDTVRRQSVLRGCPNFAHILATCTENEPFCVLTEYSELGDLKQFLKTRRYSISSTLDPGTLLYIAAQISCGMKYLEKLGYVHRDLAARNCLIDYKYNIKITDYAMFRPLYAKDYHLHNSTQAPEHKEVLPLRWIPWEVYIMGAWSIKSDVWSFGVTLWEIFNESHETVFGDLSEEQLKENLNHWYHSDGFQLLPSNRSLSCSKELSDLMNECWSREPESRPKFSEIYTFLNHKVLGGTRPSPWESSQGMPPER